MKYESSDSSVNLLSDRNRGYVESFENSSFTRPLGGVIEVKLVQTSKNEKVVCGSLLEFHTHRI
jgi:hypothetical protein